MHFLPVWNPLIRCYKEDGPTRFQTRLFKQCGYNVVRLPHHELDTLHTQAEKDTYLRKKLQKFLTE